MSPSFLVLSDLVFPCRVALVLLVYVPIVAFIGLWPALCLRFLMLSMVRLQRRRTEVLELGDRLGQSGYRHLPVIDILGTGAVVQFCQYYDPKLILPKAYSNPRMFGNFPCDPNDLGSSLDFGDLHPHQVRPLDIDTGWLIKFAPPDTDDGWDTIV